MELDDDFKKLIKELGNAINESLAESEKISDVMGKIRSAGYDLFLVLEVTIGFNKRGSANQVHRQKISSDEHVTTEFQLTSDDAQFLRELKISVDESLR